MMPLPLLVFSDLDGTLLCHETYSWQPARPALEALRQVGAGLVLASSKTSSEIGLLRAEMGLSEWPAIVENGAGVLPPGGDFNPSSERYDKIRRCLSRLDQTLRDGFLGFGDMDVCDVKAATGLSTEDAARAKERCFSEPGIWSGTAKEKQAFLNRLAQDGIHAREGGRFLTLSFGQTKADRMSEIILLFRPDHTLALGDAPNDVEMLETAEIGVIVANPHRTPLPHLAGEDTGQIIRTTAPGPQAWAEAVLDTLHTHHLI